jgi:DNA-directed RNA polymerase specialized sigma24 family protein
MVVPSDFEEISLNGIVKRCQQESELFFQRQSFDPRYCFELFRRAFLLRSDAAWECIFRQYRHLVFSWIARHPLAAGLDEEPEYFLNRAFEKIWKVITPQKFAEFSDLKSVLRYLQLCVHSVIVDYARAREQAELLAEDSEPERLAFSDEDPDDNGVENKVSSRLQGREIWGWLSQRLKTEQERVLVFTLFVLALKPREVFDEYPGTFSSIDEIYMVKENLLSRLRRDKGLLHALRTVEETPFQNESKNFVKSGTSVPVDAGNTHSDSVYKGR